MKRRLIAVSAALLSGALLLQPVPSSAISFSSGPETPDLKTAIKAVDAKDFNKAINMLNKIVAKEPKNADALNYLGYSHRKLGNYTKGVAFYKRALAIDPDHQGANEYLGQAYLELDNLEGAEARLNHLAKVCNKSCDAYKSLAESVMAYKTKKGPMKQSSRW